MSEPAPSSSGTSFSDMAEMPPLKAPVLPPPMPEPVEAPRPTVQINPRKTEEKPRIQPREVAGKAMQEIATVPPRLMLYSILGALGLILLIAIAVFFHVHSEDDGSTVAPQPTKAAKQSQSEEQPVEQAPVAPRVENPAPAPVCAHYGGPTEPDGTPSRKAQRQESTEARASPGAGRDPRPGADRLHSAGRAVSGRREKRSVVGYTVYGGEPRSREARRIGQQGRLFLRHTVG